MRKVVGIRFKRACKVNEYECEENLNLLPGDFVIVEVEKGLGMGSVAWVPKDAAAQKKAGPLKKVLRKASDADMERLKFNAQREKESLAVCTKKIKAYGLPMKLVRAEYLFDSSKAIFYFTSDSRVDFRRLVKDLASYFHTRIEMRQIGVRDEAKMLGGIGPCGRELCCSSFLPDFTPVTIKMAKQQNLALNPSKISGVCGRLMCCLSYEHQGYSGSAGKGRRGRKPGGDKKPCGEKQTSCERQTESVRKSGGERQPGGDRRPSGNRRPESERQTSGDKQSGGERKPGWERQSGRERRPGGDRRPRGNRRHESERHSDGDKQSNGDKHSGGERKTGGERQSGRERRPGGDRRPRGNRRPGAENKNSGNQNREKSDGNTNTGQK